MRDLGQDPARALHELDGVAHVVILMYSIRSVESLNHIRETLKPALFALRSRPLLVLVGIDDISGPSAAASLSFSYHVTVKMSQEAATELGATQFRCSLAQGTGIAEMVAQLAMLCLPQLTTPTPTFSWPMPPWFRQVLDNPTTPIKTTLSLNTPPFNLGFIGWADRLLQIIPSCEALSLEKCRLCDKGLSYLQYSIVKNETILSLNLSQNYLSYSELKHFLDELEAHNFTLCGLFLSETQNPLSTKNNLQAQIYDSQHPPEDADAKSTKEDAEGVLQLATQRVPAYAKFNYRIRQVLDGLSQELTLSVDLEKRKAVNSGTSMPLKTSRLNDLFVRIPALTSLTIENWFPVPTTGADPYLPKELFRLPNLQKLVFLDCVDPSSSMQTFFYHLPSEIIHLPKLKHLTLSGCGMRVVDDGWINTTEENAILLRLPHLESLCLSRNFIQHLPNSIAFCQSLKRLDISQNRLDTLPCGILQLTNLTSLNASRNRIASVPGSLTKYLQALVDLRIFQQGPDPDRSILVSDAREEIKVMRLNEKVLEPLPLVNYPSIVNHLQAQLAKYSAEGRVQTNSFKLFALGDNGHGKTSVLQHLRAYADKTFINNDLSLPVDPLPYESRNGVNISTIKFRKQDEAPSLSGLVGHSGSYNFTCHDLSGEDSLASPYNFFLNEHAVIMVIFACTSDQSKLERSLLRLDFWMNVVRTRYPFAYVIIVGTFTDRIMTEKEKISLRETLKRKYQEPKAKKVLAVQAIELVSNYLHTGFADLARAIMQFPSFIQKIHSDGQPNLQQTLEAQKTKKVVARQLEMIKLSWLLLLERATAVASLLPIPLLTWERWHDIGVDELGLELEDLKNATKFFHAITNVYWFEHDAILGNFVFVHPPLVADAYASILNARPGFRGNGVITEAQLAVLWRSIPLDLHVPLIAILHKFDYLYLVEPFAGRKVLSCARPETLPTPSALPRHVAMTANSPPPSANFNNSGKFVQYRKSSSASCSPLRERITHSHPPSGSPGQAYASSSNQRGPDPITSSTGAWNHKPTKRMEFRTSSNPLPPASGTPSMQASSSNDSTPTGSFSAATSPLSPRGRDLSTSFSAAGRYFVLPALLPKDAPTEQEFQETWKNMPGQRDYVRMYEFEFVPRGFFPRLLVRVLHSGWKFHFIYKYGFAISQDTETVFIQWKVPEKLLSLRVRGNQSYSRLGALFSSISMLLDDWIAGAGIKAPHFTVKVKLSAEPHSPSFELADLEALSERDQRTVPNPVLNAPPIQLDHIAPDVVTSSMMPCKRYVPSELTESEELSRGSYGKVSKGHLLDGTLVAIKKLFQSNESSARDSTLFTEFRHECWLMHQLAHRNIVRLVGMATEPEHIMVLEFMDGGTLCSYLHESDKSAQLTISEKCELALGVAKGIFYLHSMDPPIIHRDLKSPNVLLTFFQSNPDGTRVPLKVPIPKIADFGLAMPLYFSPSAHKQVVDNPEWLAPEAIAQQPYNEKADVYSFGVMLYEIAVRKRFLAALSAEHLNNSGFMSDHSKAILTGLRPQLPVDLPPVLSTLIRACWHQTPALRPSFDRIIQCLETQTPYVPDIIAVEQPEPTRLVLGAARGLSIIASDRVTSPNDSLNQPVDDDFVFYDPDELVSSPPADSNTASPSGTAPHSPTHPAPLQRSVTPPLPLDLSGLDQMIAELDATQVATLKSEEPQENQSSNSMPILPPAPSKLPVDQPLDQLPDQAASSSYSSLSDGSNDAATGTPSPNRIMSTKGPPLPRRLPNTHGASSTSLPRIDPQRKSMIVPGVLDAASQADAPSADVEALEAWLAKNRQALVDTGLPPLHYAAQVGNLVAVKHLLKLKRAVVDEYDHTGRLATHSAATAGNIQVLQELFAFGADISTLSKDGFMPIHLSIMKGHMTTSNWLLTNCKFEPVALPNGALPMHLACLYGQKTIVETLLNSNRSSLTAAVAGTGGKAPSLNKLSVALDLWLQFCPGMLPIHFACLGGHVDLVKWLIDKGSKVDSQTLDARQPLHFAAESPSHSLVEFLLSKGASPLAVDSYGHLPIHYAAKTGRLSVVDLFVSLKVEPLVKSNLHATPFHFACFSGSIVLVDYLLSKKADFTHADKNQMLPIHFAGAGGSIELMQALVARGQPANTAAFEGETALHFACLHNRLPLVEWLVASFGFDLNADLSKQNSKRVVHFANEGGSFPVVKWLFDHHVDFNVTDNGGVLPIHLACASGNISLVRFLVDTVKQQLDRASNLGWSPIHYAAQSGNVDLFKYLLELKLPLGLRDVAGWQPIHVAFANGHLPLIEYLYSLDPLMIHRQTNHNWYPLHCAAQEGHLNALAWFHRKGQEALTPSLLSTSTSKGQQTIHLAAERGFIHVVKWLIENGCSMHAVDNNQWQPIHCAVDKEKPEMVEWLLSHGALLDAQDKNGNTPLSLARSKVMKDFFKEYLDPANKRKSDRKGK